MDLSKTIAKDLINEYNNIIDVVHDIDTFFDDYSNYIDTDHYTDIGDNVWVGEDVIIDKTSVIRGPAIIDDNTVVGPFVYIRGNVIIGKNCFIGHGCEIKNSILFEDVKVSHFNYIGDSILGYKTHLGAGTVISNFKNDHSFIKVNGVETKYNKLGAIIHDNVEIGCNCVVCPGTIIYGNTSIYPLTKVRGVIEGNSIMKDDNNIIIKNDD